MSLTTDDGLLERFSIVALVSIGVIGFVGFFLIPYVDYTYLSWARIRVSDCPDCDPSRYHPPTISADSFNRLPANLQNMIKSIDYGAPKGECIIGECFSFGVWMKVNEANDVTNILHLGCSDEGGVRQCGQIIEYEQKYYIVSIILPSEGPEERIVPWGLLFTASGVGLVGFAWFYMDHKRRMASAFNKE